jgi:hypothetical protein
MWQPVVDSQFWVPLQNGLTPLEFIKPQLATAVDHPPPRAGWIHELSLKATAPCLLHHRAHFSPQSRLL